MCVSLSLSLSLSLIYLSATALTDSLSIQLIELTSALVPRPRSLDRPSLSLSFCAIHLRLSGIRLSDQMEQPWKATVEAGAPAAAAAAASRLSKPISSLSLSLSSASIRREISIKSLRIFFKIGWADGVREREREREREEKEVFFQVARKIITGGKMTVAFNRALFVRLLHLLSLSFSLSVPLNTK